MWRSGRPGPRTSDTVALFCFTFGNQRKEAVVLWGEHAGHPYAVPAAVHLRIFFTRRRGSGRGRGRGYDHQRKTQLLLLFGPSVIGIVLPCLCIAVRQVHRGQARWFPGQEDVPARSGMGIAWTYQTWGWAFAPNKLAASFLPTPSCVCLFYSSAHAFRRGWGCAGSGLSPW